MCLYECKRMPAIGTSTRIGGRIGGLHYLLSPSLCLSFEYSDDDDDDNHWDEADEAVEAAETREG